MLWVNPIAGYLGIDSSEEEPTPSTCTGGLISLDLVRTYLDYPDSDTTDDVELCRMIHEAGAEFAQDCRQTILKQTLTVQLRGFGTNELILDHRPVTNLAALTKESGFNVWDDVTEDYSLEEESGVYSIRIDGWFPTGERYRATYDVGYDTIPADLVGLILNHVLLNYKDHSIGKGEDRLGRTNRAESGGSGDKSIAITFDRETFAKRWVKLVKSYRRFQ